MEPGLVRLPAPKHHVLLFSVQGKKEERTSETIQITNEAHGFNLEYKRQKRKKDGEIETDGLKTNLESEGRAVVFLSSF